MPFSKLNMAKSKKRPIKLYPAICLCICLVFAGKLLSKITIYALKFTKLTNLHLDFFNRSGLTKEEEELAQLIRIHVVTPKAPVFVTLNPRVQMSTAPCPIFYPMNINENKADQMIKLTQSAYWILRLPFVYQQMINSPITKIYTPSIRAGHFLKDSFGICKFI